MLNKGFCERNATKNNFPAELRAFIKFPMPFAEKFLNCEHLNS
jgi:hypothetical protein